MMPGHFYHSTATFEPVMKKDESFIKDGLQDALRNQGRMNSLRGTIRPYGQPFPTDSLTVLDVTYKSGGEFVFNLMVSDDSTCTALPTAIVFAREPGDPEFARIEGFEIVTVSRYEPMRIDYRLECDPFDVAMFPEAPAPAVAEALAPAVEAAPAAPPAEYGSFRGLLSVNITEDCRVDGLKVPDQLFKKMLAYADARDGFAGLASGSFGRMLYLSTVTITTVGYGDIVPITPWARTLIAVEAILGILIIGLYLNALSQRLTPPSS